MANHSNTKARLKQEFKIRQNKTNEFKKVLFCAYKIKNVMT